MTEVSPPEQPGAERWAGLERVAQEPAEPQNSAVPADGTARVPLWRRPRVLLAASGVAALGLATGLALLLTGGSTDLKVTFSLQDFFGTSGCEGGTGGFSDVGPGTDVVVRGGEGQVIGTAQLGDGPSVSMSEGIDEGVGGCIWSTTVADIPTGEDFYSISVGGRGEQTYSKEQLEEGQWEVSLELGGG